MSFPIRSHPFLQIRDREVQGIWKGLLTYGKTSRACRIPVHEKKNTLCNLKSLLLLKFREGTTIIIVSHADVCVGDSLKKNNKMQVMCKVLGQTAVSWCSRVLLAFIVVVVVVVVAQGCYCFCFVPFLFVFLSVSNPFQHTFFSGTCIS